MPILLPIFFLAIGILLLVKGADIFVTKAALLGKFMRIQPIIVGLLVVGIGTSLPELVINILSAVQGENLIGIANVIGSNVTNIGLIVGTSAIFGTVALKKKTVMRDIPLSILPVILLVGLWLANVSITPVISILFLSGYLIFAFFAAREYPGSNEREIHKFALTDGIILVFGLVVLLAGGEVTLRYAEVLFLSFGLSEVVVGAVLLAFGTTLPEFVTTMTAVLKKDGQMAIGGVLGSNVFNIMGVFSISTLISPVNLAVLQLELIYLLVISILFVVVAMTGKKLSISKLEGTLLLLVYVSYVAAVITLG